MWEPRRLTNLWAFTACYRDSFTFFYLFTALNFPRYCDSGVLNILVSLESTDFLTLQPASAGVRNEAPKLTTENVAICWLIRAIAASRAQWLNDNQ
jgi:hypothetical protein